MAGIWPNPAGLAIFRFDPAKDSSAGIWLWLLDSDDDRLERKGRLRLSSAKMIYAFKTVNHFLDDYTCPRKRGRII